MEVGANFSTQPTEESTSVEGREDVFKVVQLPKTRFDNSEAPDSHLSGNVDPHTVECKDEVKVAGESESQSGGIQILVEVNHLEVRNLRMVNHLCVSGQIEVKAMEKKRKMAQ